ncbi:phytoene synthase, putative [Babesia ovis]|uniref:Phytoene synthase, putative n=1 Tax=Babesia ovis TaxID=5869 RepID=A0A9W5T9K7_BABOV|nr:phytoene synthase, putative [Babesia ovis]
MEGHKIVLTKEFLQDFSASKQTAYSKSEPDVSNITDKQCQRSQQMLANCLNNFYDVIGPASGSNTAQKSDSSTRSDFQKILQCSKQFYEYEACIRQGDT